MLEYVIILVIYVDVVGLEDGKYICELKFVCGEDYILLVLKESDMEILVMIVDGKVIFILVY